MCIPPSMRLKARAKSSLFGQAEVIVVDDPYLAKNYAISISARPKSARPKSSLFGHFEIVQTEFAQSEIFPLWSSRSHCSRRSVSSQKLCHFDFGQTEIGQTEIFAFRPFRNRSNRIRSERNLPSFGQAEVIVVGDRWVSRSG